MNKLISIFLSVFFFSVMSSAESHSVLRVSGATALTSSSPELVLASSYGYDITLPECSSGVNDGLYFIIKDIHSGYDALGIKPASGDSIEGTSGLYMAGSQSNKFVCDGNNNNWVGVSYW